MKDVTVLAAKRLGIAYCMGGRSLVEVAETLAEEDISSLVVVDEGGYLDGIITRTDILRAALALPDHWREQPCQEWMTRDVVTVEPHTRLEEAARLLQQNDIHRVVVAQVEEEGERLRPIAVVSDSDIVYHLARRQA